MERKVSVGDKKNRPSYKLLYRHDTEEQRKERRKRLNKACRAYYKKNGRANRKYLYSPIEKKKETKEESQYRRKKKVWINCHRIFSFIDVRYSFTSSKKSLIKIIKERQKIQQIFQDRQIKSLKMAVELKKEIDKDNEKRLQRKPRWGEQFNSETGFYEIASGNPKYFPVHRFQDKVLKSKCRFTGAVAGTGGGKTVTGPLWCLDKIQHAIEKYGKCLGMIIAPTYKVLSRATMPCFVETLKGTSLEGEYLESKSYYRLPNDWGRIWAQGADNPGGLEGGQFDFVWGDEGGQFKKKTFDAIVGRTGAKMSPLLITTTPYGLGALYTEWVKPFMSGDKDYLIVQWASNVNPGYPDEEYERAKRTMTPEKFAERYDGKFMQLEGLVYPDFSRCIIYMDQKEIDDLLAIPGGKHVGGLDYGWNDPFCALCGYLTPVDDILYIWFERYRSQRTIEQHADNLPKISSMIWYSDHNPEAIRKLQRGGFTVRKARKDILAGVLAVNRRIYTGKLKIIANRCPATIGEATTYIYPEKDEEIVGDVPIDRDNHAMDPLRYMIMGLDWKKAA